MISPHPFCPSNKNNNRGRQVLAHRCLKKQGETGKHIQVERGCKSLLFPFTLISTACHSSASPWMLSRVQPTAHTPQTNPAWGSWGGWPGSAASTENSSLLRVGQKESHQERGSQQPHTGVPRVSATAKMKGEFHLSKFQHHFFFS